MKVTIAEYSSAWSQMFEGERIHLEQILPASAVIEHVGSTSVPGLAAKPVIDIMIGLADFVEADALVPKMQEAGYVYASHREVEMPYRRFFVKRRNGESTHHVH